MKKLAALVLATTTLCFGATARAAVTATVSEPASLSDVNPAAVGAVLRGMALDATLSIPYPRGADAFMPPSGTIPEPSEISLLGLGVAGLFFLRQRRKRSRN